MCLQCPAQSSNPGGSSVCTCNPGYSGPDDESTTKISLVFGVKFCTARTLHGLFPNDRNQGKQVHPVLKYRVPHGSQARASTSAVMARRRRRRPPDGHTKAAGSGGRRAPFSTDTDSHTHAARSLACPLLTLSSARPFSNCIFRSDVATDSLPPTSSGGGSRRGQVPCHGLVCL